MTLNNESPNLVSTMAVLASNDFNKSLLASGRGYCIQPTSSHNQQQSNRIACTPVASSRLPPHIFCQTHAHNMPAIPTLPPRLQEHERIEFIRQWVDRIPNTCSSSGSSGAPPQSPPTSTSSYSYLHEPLYAPTNHLPTNLQNKHVPCASGLLTGVQGDVTVSNINRMFSVSEMEAIVRSCRHFLEAGNVPSLGDIRSLLADTALLAHRNPVSIRNKVKRLLSNGKWRDYV